MLFSRGLLSWAASVERGAWVHFSLLLAPQGKLDEPHLYGLDNGPSKSCRESESIIHYRLCDVQIKVRWEREFEINTYVHCGWQLNYATRVKCIA